MSELKHETPWVNTLGDFIATKLTCHDMDIPYSRLTEGMIIIDGKFSQDDYLAMCRAVVSQADFEKEILQSEV